MENKSLLDDLFNMRVDPPKAKIYQYQQQRYALRLEPPFIRILNLLAKERNMRPGALIHALKQESTHKNFSSYIRALLMAEAEKRLSQAGLSQKVEQIDFFLETAPMPALLISENQTILTANSAFLNWVHKPPKTLREERFSDLFQIRDNQTVRLLIDRLKMGHQEQASLNVTYRGPSNPVNERESRISLEAKAILAPYSGLDEKAVYFVIWLQTAYNERPARIVKIRR